MEKQIIISKGKNKIKRCNMRERVGGNRRDDEKRIMSQREGPRTTSGERTGKSRGPEKEDFWKRRQRWEIR
jgi:hypothetical protein